MVNFLWLQADFWRITDEREAGAEDDFGRPLGKVGYDDKGTLSQDFLGVSMNHFLLILDYRMSFFLLCGDPCNWASFTFLVSTQSRQSAKLFSSRRNWDSPNPSPAGECAPSPLVPGGRGTLASEWGGGRVPIPARGPLWCSVLYVLCGCQLRHWYMWYWHRWHRWQFCEGFCMIWISGSFDACRRLYRKKQ